ncbi:hypothetical protein OSSY52_12210 [Tepiditoga spiralis]|uniref:Uncharacterized protein n=2 Tax=Tepiditoga spiralis TaxID=2108365 RepID=A0A7G1G3R5_9BACT|nr:hypothetical protein OSSY52_12210 [Tepiditoga spiralis]
MPKTPFSPFSYRDIIILFSGLMPLGVTGNFSDNSIRFERMDETLEFLLSSGIKPLNFYIVKIILPLLLGIIYSIISTIEMSTLLKYVFVDISIPLETLIIIPLCSAIIASNGGIISRLLFKSDVKAVNIETIFTLIILILPYIIVRPDLGGVNAISYMIIILFVFFSLIVLGIHQIKNKKVLDF